MMMVSPGPGSGGRSQTLNQEPADYASDGYGRLLVLGGELHRAHREFQGIQRVLRFPLGMNELADVPQVIAVRTGRDARLNVGDRW